tara:strand:- start:26 stop:874 length:849 start_codon:yes stop_codon:yes gene_type:complete
MPIIAKIIARSVHTNSEIITFELEYPRFIHSELMTHRVFSRNGASSRAIPIKKQIGYICESTAFPIAWGKNKAGMQATELIEDPETALQVWNSARDSAITHTEKFIELGIHKQVSNRILEPFSHMKLVLTATEFSNWFELRDHEDAQPEIRELAKQMINAMERTVAKKLESNEWHVPYYNDGHWCKSCTETLDDAIAISASCCAQVSYRKLDDSLDKAKDIYAKLVDSKPMHASPFEHQACPIIYPVKEWETVPGITHMDKKKNLWSNNFKGWVQYRSLLNV